MSTQELLHMSQTEINRLELIQQVEAKQLAQKSAAKQLGITTRQLRRLQRRYQQHGPQGLISKHRGKVPGNKLPECVRTQALALIEKNYPDFGPTFAHEKLTELHGLTLSVETLRQWMIQTGHWQGKQRKVARIHQSRPRRTCLGELVQIDGSPHAWFEDRGPVCCLLVFVDDATGQIMQLHFEPNESAQGYFEATYQYILKHGKPVAFYSDKHGIFRVNAKEVEQGKAETQFARALRELDIGIICANTPQAKGRVENKNRTLQDRLVKELRLARISDISTANAYLPAFMEDYNRRFAKAPACTTNQHRPNQASPAELRKRLCHQETRIITKNLEVHYNGRVYQIQSDTPSYNMRKAKVLVCESHQRVTLWYKDRVLPYRLFDKKQQVATIGTSKEVNTIVDQFLYGSSVNTPP